MRVVIDEATIKIAKAEEGLNVFYLSRSWPFRDSTDLFLIHSQARRRQDEAEILHGLNVEFAFLGATEQAVFAESSEDFADVLAVIG